jgi:iduronate 2-sulfatase
MNRRSFLSSFAAAGLARGAGKKNVLLIAVDDMRPELGCYGARNIHSPNIDALAARGTLFQKAYCQQAVCSPSRTSLLTGLRPDTTKVYDLQTHFRGSVPDAVTLPEYFKNNGYVTAGMGKLFHGGLDDSRSWSIPWWGPGQKHAWNSAEALEQAKRQTERLRSNGWKLPPAAGNEPGSRGPSWEASDLAGEELPDGRTATQAIAALKELKSKPFFLGVGFVKPHLPFIAPKKYFDLYPLDKVEMPDYPELPTGAPPFAGTNSGELRSYGDIGSGKISAEKAKELVRAYYACISYTDAMIGRVLGELDRQGLRDSTMVVLFGDHGWHLNNHGNWNKHTNYEKATRSMLIAAMPGQKQKGVVCDRLVEFVDVYPSLAEGAGLKVPESIPGRSFVPLLSDAKQEWKSVALSQYPRTYQKEKLMGYSVRNSRFRMTEWRKVGTTEVVARELYDYQEDPQESVNRADRPEMKATIAAMSAELNRIVR